MRVVIIGSGNVATILGQRISEASHQVMQVWSRNGSHAIGLAAKLNAEPSDDLSKLAVADIYIIAVSDAAVPLVSKQLKVKSGVVVHTAGSVPIRVLEGCSSNTGILYPLQSIRKESSSQLPIPLLVDGNNERAFEVIEELATSISKHVRRERDESRLHLHVAAVVLNNFANHLYTLIADYCKKTELDFSLLLPLITETAARMQHMQPQAVQTGPAVRNDQGTIDKNLLVLKEETDLSEFYRLFSQKILNYYSEK